MANKIIQFCHEISLCYENKLGLIPEKKKNHKYIKNIIESLNITKVENDDIFVKLLKNVHKLLIETIDLISQEQPEMAFKLFLFSASQINSINCKKEKLEESCIMFIKNALNIFEEGRYNKKKM